MEGQIPGSTWMSRQVLPAAAGSGWLGEGGWKFWRTKVPLLMCFCWAIARGPEGCPTIQIDKSLPRCALCDFSDNGCGGLNEKWHPEAPVFEYFGPQMPKLFD